MTFHSSLESQFASVQGRNCTTVPNFVEIGQTAPELWRFLDFPRWRPPPSWIFKISYFNCRTAQMGRIALPCQISSKSAKPRPRYDNFSIFQDGGHRHLEFSNLWNFKAKNAQVGQTESSCQISSKSVKLRLRYGDFSVFQDGGPRHLGFLKF